MVTGGFQHPVRILMVPLHKEGISPEIVASGQFYSNGYDGTMHIYSGDKSHLKHELNSNQAQTVIDADASAFRRAHQGNVSALNLYPIVT